MKLRLLSIALLMGVLVIFSCNNENTQNENVSLNTDVDSVSYAIGSSIGKNLSQGGLDTTVNRDALIKGILDVLDKEEKLLIPEVQAQSVIQSYFGKQQKVQMEKLKTESAEYLESNKKKEGVKTLESGLQYEVINDGTGDMPNDTSLVKVHYHGTLVDGNVFDSSVERGKPAEFNVNRVIPGWTEALQLMKTGSKWKLTIPYNLAYGERGSQSIPPFSTLIFEVELLEIVK